MQVTIISFINNYKCNVTPDVVKHSDGSVAFKYEDKIKCWTVHYSHLLLHNKLTKFINI